MSFWEWMHRLGPGWPTERQWAVILTWAMGVGMLIMTIDRPQLWREELFKTLITVVMITGFVNLILGFYFAANKSDEVKAENTGKAFEVLNKSLDQVSERPTGQPGDPVSVSEEEGTRG